MAGYLYLRPDENVLAGRTVTSTAGTPDSDHPLSYLTDLRPAFPLRYPAGAWGVSISVATQAVQLVALVNHSLDAAVTVGGGVSGTITPGTLPENGIAVNPYLLLGSPMAGVTAITLAGTNTGAAVIGEAFAGVPRTLKYFLLEDIHEEFLDGGGALQGEALNIPPYDQGLEWRVFRGATVITAVERAAIVSWFRAQRGMSRPSLLILDPVVNDARVVLLDRPVFQQFKRSDLWKATLTFREFPRYVWT